MIAGILDVPEMVHRINGLAHALMEESDVAFSEGHAHGIHKSKAVLRVFPCPSCIVADVAGKNSFSSEFNHTSVRLQEIEFEYSC